MPEPLCFFPSGGSIALAHFLIAVCPRVKRSALFAPLLFISAITSAATPGEAFQGVPWGATEAQIRQKFGERVTIKKCESEIERHFHAIANHSCDTPTIRPYEVAGIPFDLNFELDANTKRLDQVVMFHSGSPPDETDELKVGTFWARYHSLKDALTARYGAAPDPLIDEKEGWVYVAQTWTTSSTKVELSLKLYMKPGYSTESYQVWYKPRMTADAKKL
jgi:hypothetical protein